MLRLLVGPDDLARTRFGVSPLMELENVLRLLSARTTRPDARVARLRPEFDRLCRDRSLRILLALHAPGYGVNFLAPQPSSMGQTLADDLATVRATPLPVARREVAEALRRRPVGDPAVVQVLKSRRLVEEIAQTQEEAWQRLVAPTWPAIRALLERDVLHRAARLARDGWAGALTDLDPRLSWRSGELRVRRREHETYDLAGKGMLLVPAAHVWPHLITFTDPPWRATIVYPARGVAALWSEAPVTPPQALRRLLGRGRSEVLTALVEPASTTQLVHALGQSLGSVGGHLAVLRDAGLVVGERAGRSVRYRRTALGDALAGSADAG